VPARKRDFESIGVLICFIFANNKSEIYNATAAQQAAKKLGIFSANVKSVIPEVAKSACGGESRKNNTLMDTGSRLRLVRYDVWAVSPTFSEAC